jgi:hypothetical protein
MMSKKARTFFVERMRCARERSDSGCGILVVSPEEGGMGGYDDAIPQKGHIEETAWG